MKYELVNNYKGEKHMRSVNVTYKIYEFSELSEDAKAKVKEW